MTENGSPSYASSHRSGRNELSKLRRRGLFAVLSRPIVAIPLALIAALVLGPFVSRWYRLAGISDSGDPFDVQAISYVEIKDEDNAFVEYRAASKLLVKPETLRITNEEHRNAWDNGWPAASENMHVWLDRNRPALAEWRKGTEKPQALYLQPRKRTGITETELGGAVQELLEFRTLGELARLEGSRLEHEGQLAEASKWYRAMFRYSRHFGRHGTTDERKVGVAFHGQAVESMIRWAAHPDVDSDDIRAALRAVVADYARTGPPSESLKVDYLIDIHRADYASKCLHFYSTRWGMPVIGASAKPLKPIASVAVFALGEPELSRRVMRLGYWNYLSQIDVPRQTRAPWRPASGLFEVTIRTKPDGGEVSYSQIETYSKRAPFAKVFLSLMPAYDSAMGREQAQQALLVVALVAQLHYREHSEFPEDIRVFVGEYLAQVPLDPFGQTDATLHYRRDQSGALIWSVGPNGVDDGGVFNSDWDRNDVGYRIAIPRRSE